MVRYRPYVVLNAAMTLDGRIATRKGDSAISSQVDLERVHRLRAKVDAILVGINTVLTDDPLLTANYARKHPTRIIVDSKARISFATNIIRSSNSIPTVIAVSDKAPKSKVEKIKSSGAT
ncbi:MAG: dihydrofolate reductase family protein, partial [Nitrososphaerales archaeon]